MKKTTLIPVLFFAFCFLFSTASAFAAGLVPCGGDGESACTFCHLVQLGENIIYNLLLKIGPTIATIFIIWGAFMMMLSGGSPEKAKKGREIMTSAIVGLVIAFAAWLIIDTIFNFLVKGSGGMSNFSWNLWKMNIPNIHCQ